ncbi:hypothetical protein ACQP00_39300 [Dactylosporangium sp. CS-047395]|uniref:hypothetical protein n=1 Tax=Dactylosporangium sp. CS-047395 TaxID=3239936 RepID=UPI003D92F9DE
MATFLLTWNPDVAGWDDAAHAGAVHAGRAVLGRWGVGIRRSGISVGDRAFLFRQRHERGVVARATFTSEIYENAHWDGSGRTTTFAEVAFDTLLPVGDRIPVEVLRAVVPGVPWDHLQGSGVAVRPPAAADLERLWRDHVKTP